MIDINAVLGMPVVDEVLKLIREFLAERQSEREFTMALIKRTESQELIDALIKQHLAEAAIRIENRQWWQLRFRALGDIFDGDAWERLVELFKGIGVDLPGDAPENA